MREIKFRAWVKEESPFYGLPHMIPILGIDDYEVIEADAYDGSERSRVNSYRRNDIELMQYTGLKDKNGREIYEGDIVRYYEYTPDEEWQIDEVEWMDDHEGDGFRATGFVSLTYDYPEGWEVIGNIYENPELLKGGV